MLILGLVNFFIHVRIGVMCGECNLMTIYILFYFRCFHVHIIIDLVKRSVHALVDEIQCYRNGHYQFAC